MCVCAFVRCIVVHTLITHNLYQYYNILNIYESYMNNCNCNIFIFFILITDAIVVGIIFIELIRFSYDLYRSI